LDVAVETATYKDGGSDRRYAHGAPNKPTP